LTVWARPGYVDESNAGLVDQPRHEGALPRMSSP
jgi:hypothetical protein